MSVLSGRVVVHHDEGSEMETEVKHCECCGVAGGNLYTCDQCLEHGCTFDFLEDDE